MWAGIGEGSKVIIIVLAAFFPILVNTESGVEEGVSAVVTAVFGAIGCLAEPFSDFSCFRKLRTKH